MFRVPDEATLSQCAVFVSLCFSATFLALRLRQPSQVFWSYWAASGGAYVIGVVALNELPSVSPAIGAMLYAMLSSATILTFAGMRAFAGLAPWRWWIVVLLALPPFLYLAGAILMPGATTPGLAPVQRLAGGIGLTLVLTTCGIALVRGAAADALGGWSRAVGIAFLAHLPSYATVLASAYASVSNTDDLTSYLWMTQPVLMVAIDLILLAMPGMVAMARLRELASRDGLTGVFNRYWLGECDRVRAAAGVRVAMIDLDGFKDVNDRCGHAAGDGLLIAFATHLRRWADAHRGEVVRLGGDEFLVLFPLDDDALTPALLRHIAAAPHGPEVLPPWSASVGVAPCPPGSTTLQAAMHQADVALYHVKRDRRAARAQAA